MNVGSIGAASSGVFCHLRFRRSRNSASLCLFPAKVLSRPLSFHISSSLFGRSRGRPPLQDQHSRQKNIYTDRNFDFSVDVNDISTRAVDSIKRCLRASEAKINRFCSAGTAAYDDLSTSFRIERGSRIVFSCRRSSLQFFANLFFWSFAVVLAFMFATWCFRRRWGFGSWTVTRRDRSLGGREVVVGRKNTMRKFEKWGFKGLVNPLSNVADKAKTNATLMRKQNIKQENLPEWWPNSISSPVILFAKEGGQREANKLLKAIMDNRLSGKDYKDDDFIQLRQICRSSGARVAFETANARDSFFRAAISFVFSVCSRVRPTGTTVWIDGEEANRFICGLAYNIELDNLRAARLICAAVAAYTRSCFLQSWAFEVQGRRMEALEELLNLSQIYHIFPLEENSAELEMVASVLKTSFGVDQRVHLLTLFTGVCSLDSRRIAAEALGLASNASV